MTRLLISCALVLVATAAEARTLRIWRDCSTSMSERALAQVVAAMVDVLRESSAVDRVELLRFSCGNEPIEEAEVRNFVLQRSVRDTGLVVLFKQGQRVIESEGQVVRDEVLRNLSTDLLATLTAQAPCTRFDDLAVRLAEEDVSLNLVLTDAWVDCRQSTPPLSNPRGLTVVVVLPRGREPAGAQYNVAEARIRDMRRFFPAARIVRSFGIRKSLEDLLAGEDVVQATR